MNLRSRIIFFNVRTVITLMLGTMVLAANLSAAPRLDGRVNTIVTDQPLPAFLHELFGAAGYATLMSSAVSGRVDGRVEGSIESVLRDISRKHAVTFYYVDKIVYVYSNGEIGARILPTKPTQANVLKQRAQDRQMLDANNYLARADNGTLVAIGTPRFLDQLDDLAAKLAAETVSNPKPLSAAERAARAAKRELQLAAKRAEKPASQREVSAALATKAASQVAGSADPGITAPLVPVEAPASKTLNEPIPSSALTPPVSPAAVSGESGNASRAPLRPSIVWRSAYAPPEPGEAKSR